MKNIKDEIDQWVSVFSANYDPDDITDTQAEEIKKYLLEDGFLEEEINEAFNDYWR